MGKDLELAVYNVSSTQLETLKESFLKGIPLQYLLKFSEFYGHLFYVDERVLIPRPETEYMVEILLGKKKNFGSVLDVGTGSGVIILSLLAQGFAKRGVACDLSSEALNVARINAGRLRIECDFVISDRLEKITDKFDVIVSNPPYIKESAHRSGVHDSVDSHEPHLALYLKDTEYQEWFTKFFSQVFTHLNPGGLFMMEGHEHELESQADQLRQAGFTDVEVLNDLARVPRFLLARTSL